MKNTVIRWTGCALMALSACNDEAQTGIAKLGGEPVFAVQRSDYDSTGAIALIDGDGVLLKESYISSGTQLPGLNTALASDISLPSTPCDPEVLTVIGRKGGEYVLQVSLDDSQVLRQFRMQGEGNGTAFSANPHDILCLGDGRALVTRYGVNLSVDAANVDRADDIALVDLEKQEILSRVDLSAYYGSVTFLDKEQNEVTQETYATPDGIMRVGPKHAIVGIAKMSKAFKANRSGGVLLLNLDDLSHEQVPVEGLANCGQLFTVADRANAVIVQCNGIPWGSLENSGLALVSVEDGKAKVEHVFKAADQGASVSTNPTSLGGTRAIVVASGYVNDVGDKAYVVDLAKGTFEVLLSAALPGDLGSGATRFETGLVLLPDASVGVRVFKIDGDVLGEQDPIALDGAIPARNVRALRDF